MPEAHQPLKQQVARSFSAAAHSYDSVAMLQRTTADELLDRLNLIKLSPMTIVDLGAGTGRNLPLLQQRYPQAQLVAIDIAADMLQFAKQQFRQQQGLKRFLPKQKKPVFLSADAEQLPLATDSVDLLYANLTLQWCAPQQAFTEINRVLKPGGLVMFSSLGPDTLQELRLSWAAVDSAPHINQFLDMHDVASAMQQSGLADAVLDVDRHQLTYPDMMQMMRDLKLLGAANQLAGRRRGLTGKKMLKEMLAASEQFRQQGLIPATYEVIYGHAWGATAPQQCGDDGSVRITLEQFKRGL